MLLPRHIEFHVVGVPTATCGHPRSSPWSLLMAEKKRKHDAFYRINLDWEGTITTADGTVIKVEAPDPEFVEAAYKARETEQSLSKKK